jgi:dipeptidase
MQYGPGETITLVNGGSLEQVAETWAYIWAEMPEMTFSDSYLNEWGVCIASDACLSREDNPELTDGGISYMLRRLVAERARSAREGVLLAGQLIERFGYASSGRTYTICDPEEGWLLCAVNGKHWLAQRVPDDEVAIIANTYIVHEVDLSDTGNFLASSDIIDYAVSRGWYDPNKDGAFDFALAYSNPGNAADSANFCRQWGGLRLVAADPPRLDKNLPFSVKPHRKLGVADLMQVLRDHYEDVNLYQADPGSGDPHRVGVRSICARTTQTSFVAQLRHNLPAEIGLVYWVCLGAPCTSFYLPYYFGLEQFPAGYASDEERPSKEQFGERIEAPFKANMHRAFWTFANFHGHACTNYSEIGPRLISERESLEMRAVTLQKPLERTAAQMYPLDPRAAMEILSNFSEGMYLSAMEALESLATEE